MSGQQRNGHSGNRHSHPSQSQNGAHNKGKAKPGFPKSINNMGDYNTTSVPVHGGFFSFERVVSYQCMNYKPYQLAPGVTPERKHFTMLAAEILMSAKAVSGAPESKMLDAVCEAIERVVGNDVTTNTDALIKLLDIVVVEYGQLNKTQNGKPPQAHEGGVQRAEDHTPTDQYEQYFNLELPLSKAYKENAAPPKPSMRKYVQAPTSTAIEEPYRGMHFRHASYQSLPFSFKLVILLGDALRFNLNKNGEVSRMHMNYAIKITHTNRSGKESKNGTPPSGHFYTELDKQEKCATVSFGALDDALHFGKAWVLDATKKPPLDCIMVGASILGDLYRQLFFEKSWPMDEARLAVKMMNQPTPAPHAVNEDPLRDNGRSGDDGPDGEVSAPARRATGTRVTPFPPRSCPAATSSCVTRNASRS